MPRLKALLNAIDVRPARAARIVVALAGCLVAVGCGPVPTPSGAPPAPSTTVATAPFDGPQGAGIPATVSRVIDGDTIVLDDGQHVRLVGLDTPESVGDRPVGCFGPEASAFLHDRLPPGTAVELFFDKETTDRYGRTLAYVVTVEPREFINATLVREGFGRVMTIPPNGMYASMFERLASEARSTSKGLWGAC
jgi:micrococcal nuclease